MWTWMLERRGFEGGKVGRECGRDVGLCKGYLGTVLAGAMGYRYPLVGYGAFSVCFVCSITLKLQNDLT